MNRPSWGNSPTSPSDIENLIPEDSREEVMDVLVDEALSAEKKIDWIKKIVNTRVLMMIVTYLQALEPTSSCPDDFLNLVKDERKKRMIRRALQNEDMESLEMLISKETRQVQLAFEKWKTESQMGSGSSQNSSSPSSSRVRNYDAGYDSRSDVSFQQQRSQLKSNDSGVYFSRDDADTISQLSDSFSEKASFADDHQRPTEVTINTDFLEKLPNCTNILVLGETGSGKSTFINGLANYLKYGTMQEALSGGVEVLIKAFFYESDDDYNGIRIDCEPTVKPEISGDADDNEHTEEGKSCTQAPKSYLFTWGERGSKKAIRIIDTPGVGDVRGVHQEDINFGKIISFVAQFKEIHAICILMKSNNSRLTLTFRYCVNELLTHLHISSKENILWCFTNARQSDFKPGESLPTLKSHLKTLKEERKIELKTNRDNMYCFDNEAFKYLCAMENGAYFHPSTEQHFNDSWNQTKEATFRMFKRISKLKPHNVQDLVSLNQIRSVVMGLSRPLVEISRNQLLNAKLIADKLLEIEDCKRLEIEYVSKLHVDQVLLTPKELNYPITVCTAKSCVSHERLTSDPNSPMQTVYKTECHERCYLTGVQTSICPNTDLQHCWALQEDIDRCRVCTCPWSTHMHIRYKMERTMENVTDPDIQKRIKENADKLETAELFVKKQKKMKEEYEREVKTITSHSAEFVAFIAKNSVLPYNDSYKEYLEHLIKEEKDMGDASTMLKSLEMLKEQHEEMIKLAKNRPSSKAKSLDQIYKMIEELKKQKHCGWIIEDVQRLEMAGVRKQQTTVGTSVDLNQGWFGKLVSKIPSGSKAANFFSGKRK